MRSKYDKVICYFIVTFIMFSGICLEQPTADSLFACVDNISSTSYISSPEGELSRCELSTTEMLGIRDTVFVASRTKRSSIRVLLRLSLLLFLAEVILARVSSIQAAVETTGAPETHYFTALLNYIHRQDGKK